MILFMTFIFCFIILTGANEKFDKQYGLRKHAKDLAEEEKSNFNGNVDFYSNESGTRIQNGFRDLNFNARSILDCKQRIYGNKNHHGTDNDRNEYADQIDELVNCIMENQQQIQILKRKVHQLTQRSQLRANNKYRMKSQSGYRNLNVNAASIHDCKQTSFGEPALTALRVGKWEVFYNYLNQFFDCMMKKFTSTQLQLKRLLTDQLQLRQKIRLLTRSVESKTENVKPAQKLTKKDLDDLESRMMAAVQKMIDKENQELLEHVLYV